MNKIKKNLERKIIYLKSDIAKIMKVKQNTISQWENNKRLPNVKQGIELAEILKTTVEVYINRKY